MGTNPLRKLPSVNAILDSHPLRDRGDDDSHEAVVAAVRAELASIRSSLRDGTDGIDVPDAPAIAVAVALRLKLQSRPALRAVINATGILLHTNLGRAPMAESAASAAHRAAHEYLNLELDLLTGKRSSRQSAVREQLCRLTGAESATAVNNNAAATIIVLRALCRGREVVVSRGQLIEIGGSFRIPEIMAVSGAVLHEVGTTNITRTSDFERALNPETGAILRVHTSNYRVRGFTKSVSLAELVALGRKYSLPVLDDVGSGALLDFARFGFQSEPIVAESIAAGADLVLFSGDKLLGGPQAGIIVGRKKWIQLIERDPIMRGFRLDKMTLAALEATLRLYVTEERALAHVPVLRLLSVSLDELRLRAEALAEKLKSIPGISHARARKDTTAVGGGSLPDQPMPTWTVEIRPDGWTDSLFARRLRTGNPPVVGRLRKERLVLDLRTVFPRQDAELLAAVQRAADKSSEDSQ